MVTKEQASSWKILADPAFRRRVTIKDSVRESYFAAVAAIKSDMLTSEEFRSDPDYAQKLEEEMNDTSPEMIAQVEQWLKGVKDNVFSFETDAGKADMITGKVAVNYQWSGDGVYTMDQADEDEFTLAFLAATRESGFDIIPGKRVSRNGYIGAVAKAKECYKKLGDFEYRHMLALLKNTWGGEKWSVENTILAGMCLLISTYGTDIDDDRFMKKLAEVDEIDINRAATKYYDLSMPYRYAMALGSLYNKGGAKGTLKLRKLTISMFEEE
jgi:hypothetical protein